MASKPVGSRAAALITALSVSVTSLLAQTAIKLPKNKYTPEQDVELGREAAAEVRKQYPIISDERIARYLTTLGDRLVAAAPPELKQPVYEYSFTPVNLKEINAFALPGGPMFVNRGMFDAAASRGRGRRRDGARAVSRPASARHGQRDRRRRIPGCSLVRLPARSAAPWSAAPPDRQSRRAASSDSARCSCDTAATSRSRRICSARRSWRAPATTRARSRTCSRRSSAKRRAAAAAARSG